MIIVAKIVIILTVDNTVSVVFLLCYICAKEAREFRSYGCCLLTSSAFGG